MTLGISVIIINTAFYDNILCTELHILSMHITRAFSFTVFILLLLCANQLAMEYIGYKNLVCCNENGVFPSYSCHMHF